MTASVIEQHADLVRRTRVHPAGGREVGLLVLALGLANEANEAAQEIRRPHETGWSVSDTALAEELGDVLWYVHALALAHGMDLHTLLTGNITKLELRAAERDARYAASLKDDGPAAGEEAERE